MYSVSAAGIIKTSATSANLVWQPSYTSGVQGLCPGYGAVTIFMGADKNNVNNNCGLTATQADAVYNYANLGGCFVFNVPYYNKTQSCNQFGTCKWIYTAITSYTTPNILNANTVYYYKVISLFNGISKGYNTYYCGGPASQGYVTSCSVNPSSATLSAGQTQTLSTTINPNAYITNVSYSGNPVYTSFNPTSTATSPYSTVVTGLAQTYPYTTSVTSTINLSGGASYQCTASHLTITQPSTANPWWQVQDADVATAGDLKSAPPGSNLFDLAGGGGYPGIPLYGGATTLTTSNVSAAKWLVNSSIGSSKIFDYQYFANLVPAGTITNSITNPSIGSADLTGGQIDPTTGYYWYKYDGSVNNNTPLTISSAVNIGSKKVILLVNAADLDINGNINLTKGQGFFMTTVGQDSNGNGGNIIVSPTVGGGGSANLEGIYEADGSFQDGTNQPTTNDNQLWIRGSIVAYGSVGLSRDLGGTTNLTVPAELMEFAPDQIMLFPSVLGERKINWKEVAP